MQTGDYSSVFVWEKVVKTQETTYGQKKHSFTDSGILWGNLKLNSAATETSFGGSQSQVRAVITLNQFPAVSAEDRLTDQYGVIWIINGVRQDRASQNETILDCHSYDHLTTI